MTMQPLKGFTGGWTHFTQQDAQAYQHHWDSQRALVDVVGVSNSFGEKLLYR